LFSNYVVAQDFHFELNTEIEVNQDGELLKNAWSGGINSAQFSTIDLNNDGKEDLFIFDRTNNKGYTYLNVNNTWVYSPEYESVFPEMFHWALLVDYNCDGKKDIWTTASFGTKIYKNTSDSDGLSFKLEKELIYTLGISGSQINLAIDVTDIPSFVDVDNDGDLDILTYIPSFGSYIEYHKNFSQERYGVCDSLEFEKVTNRWGDFLECSCDFYVFGGNGTCRNEKVEHSGSTLLAFDLDEDGDKDILTGDIGCDHVSLLRNTGTNQLEEFLSFETEFPKEKPIHFPSFPAVFHEDIDFDGKKDLISSPNVSSNEANNIDFSHSAHVYKKVSKSDFEFQKDDFLQQTMLEVGEEACPAFSDADGDGDLDLFIGNRGLVQSNGSYVASIFYFQNIGTQLNPSFELVTKDYLGLSSRNHTKIRPVFTDINGDEADDLIFYAFDGREAHHIYYSFNKLASNQGLSFDFNEINTLDLDVEGVSSAPLFEDINKDGEQDLILGLQGKKGITYYRNTGGLKFVEEQTKLGKIIAVKISLTSADLDGNGVSELIVGSTDNQHGELQIYKDYTNNLTDSLISEQSFIWNPLITDYIAFNFGETFYPTTYQNDLIIGTNTGGLLYLKNKEKAPPTAINKDFVLNQVKIYPNPSHSSITIETFGKAHVEIVNLLGETIFTKQIDSFQKKLVSVSDWERGFYLVKISIKGKVIVHKLLLQ
jgi:hypothetical protein